LGLFAKLHFWQFKESFQSNKVEQNAKTTFHILQENSRSSIAMDDIGL